ncbi:MAG: hypothetical protein Q7S68_03640 [Deltaproteobacteria bacterium]|nr:hypothetical protein [Deltaproteobacteria bacterium]
MLLIVFLEAGNASSDRQQFKFNIEDYAESETGFNFAKATFGAQFAGDFGHGNASLVANKSSAENSVTGDYQNSADENDFAAHLVCKFNAATGAAKYNVEGSFPSFSGTDFGLEDSFLTGLGFSANAQLCPNLNFNENVFPNTNNNPFVSAGADGNCPFSGGNAEAFQLTTSAGQESATVVASAASLFFDSVSASSVASGLVAKPAIVFNRDWDCAPVAGFNLNEIDARAIDLSACAAIEAELESSFEDACQQQEDENEVTASQSVPPPDVEEDTDATDETDTDVLFPVVCGDGILAAPEICDDGEANGTPDQCSTTCDGTTAAICGNAVTETGEACDDGFENNSDEIFGACKTDCSGTVGSTCGNGSQEGAEECDDGNTESGDGCQANCLNPVCGDGSLDENDGEYCDDGNTDVGDGCNAVCEPECLGDETRITFISGGPGSSACYNLEDDQVACEESYHQGRGGVASCYFDEGDGWCYGCGSNNEDSGNCINTCRVPVCGDNYLSAGEDCEDGNTDSGDGCSDICELE